VKLNRIVLVTALGVLGAGLSRADIPNGVNFTIDLNDVTGTDSGGWGSEQGFTATINPTGVDPSQFTPFSMTTCTSDGVVIPNCGEPSIQINEGGDPTAVESSPFTFDADANGGGTTPLSNGTGADIKSLLILSSDYPASFFDGTTFNCDQNALPGGATLAFNFCGIQIIGSDAQVEFYFTDTPEPSFGYALLAGASMLALAARRSTRKRPI
jgi:hypothetical protein